MISHQKLVENFLISHGISSVKMPTRKVITTGRDGIEMWLFGCLFVTILLTMHTFMYAHPYLFKTRRMTTY